MTIQVWYHANCRDGFGAAYAMWKAAKEYMLLEETTFIPVKYNEPPPSVYPHDTIHIVDFSYPRAVLENLHNLCRSLTVLDHHKTAQEDLAGLPYAKFDMDKSGAILTWEFYHPNKPIPLLLQYVQDNDLWRHSMPHCKAIIRYIDSKQQDFDVWEDLSNQFEMDFDRIVNEASIMNEFFMPHVASRGLEATLISFYGYHNIPIVNTDKRFSSEVGSWMWHYYDAPFAITYVFDGDIVEVSLRGNGTFSVAEIAKHFKGGGHPNAAGFHCTPEVLTAILTNSTKES